MLLLGCKPKGRHTEQHDVFFGIAKELKELVPEIKAFWPEANGKIHIDAWREVKQVDGNAIRITERKNNSDTSDEKKLFFINLGGYKENEFDEFHYKVLTVSADNAGAIAAAKQTAFYKHTNFKGADSHIDDKYGVDVDDIYAIEDILPAAIKEKYMIRIKPGSGSRPDELYMGYFRLDKL